MRRKFIKFIILISIFIAIKKTGAESNEITYYPKPEKNITITKKVDGSDIKKILEPSVFFDDNPIAYGIDRVPDLSSIKTSLNHDINVDHFYIQRFWKIAMIEESKFKIPAEIKLIQGMIESGSSKNKRPKKYAPETKRKLFDKNGKVVKLAQSNNHFGIHYKEKENDNHLYWYGDVGGKSKMRAYDTAWQSYRDHSEFLAKRKFYRKCFDCNNKNHENRRDLLRCWTKELDKSPYAEKKYGNLMMEKIDQLNLVPALEKFRT